MIQLVEITNATAPEFRALSNLYQQEFARGEKEPLAAIRSWLSRQQHGRLYPNAYHAIAVSTQGGHVVGGAFFHYLATINSGFLGYLVVHPDWRRQGIGRQLFGKVNSLLRQDARLAKLPDPAGVFMELRMRAIGTSDVMGFLEFWRSLKVFPLNVNWRYPSLQSDAAPLEMNLAYHALHRGNKAPSGAELKQAVRAIYRFVYGQEHSGSLLRSIVRSIGPNRKARTPRHNPVRPHHDKN